MSRGANVEEELSISNSRASSSLSDSRLPERLGTSAEYRPSELLEALEVAGVVALASDIGSQQNVSLFHNLQLRFSNLRPSSNEPAQREKTVDVLVFFPYPNARNLLTCPHAEEVLGISGIDLVDEAHVDGQDRRI